MTSVLRLAVAGAIIVLLLRAAHAAWGNRDIAISVWRRIRLRHVAGSLVLLAVVLGVAIGLMTLLPLTGIGVGSLIGLAGNAVFAPVEEAAARSGSMTGPAAETVATAVDLGSLVFLAALLLLLPWLAYVEERVFREGLETRSTAGRLWAALRFGLLHLVMLVPVAAALAISVAGLWYGRVYLRAYERHAGERAPQLLPVGSPAALPAIDAAAPMEGAQRVHRSDLVAQDKAVLEATVWHATFNSTIVVLLIAGFATGWL